MIPARFPAKSCLGATCAVLFGASSAYAERKLAPQITVEACERFSAEQVSDLIELELSTDAAHLSDTDGYNLAIECQAKKIELRLLDDHREVQLERTIDEPPSNSTEPERTVALAGAELVFALGSMPHTPKPPPPPADSGKVLAASTQEDTAAFQRMESPHGTLRTSYQLNLRSLDSVPYLASGAIVAAQLQLKVPFRFGVAVGYELGNSTQQKVVSQVVSLGAQLGYAWTLSDHLDFALEFELRALHVHAERAQLGTLKELSASGWRPDFMFRVGPEWVRGSWGVAVALNGGFTAGHVELPEVLPQPYSYGGPWVGISLDLLMNRYFGGP